MKTIGTRLAPLVTVVPTVELLTPGDASVCAKESWSKVHASKVVVRIVFIRFNGPSEWKVCGGCGENGKPRNPVGQWLLLTAAERHNRFEFVIDPHQLHTKRIYTI